MHALWNLIWRDRRGAAMAELAAAMPVLVLLLLGGVEISRFAMLNQKLDRLTTTMGDLVAQADTLTGADVDKLFLAAEHVAWPFPVKTKARIIISSISIPPHDPLDPPPPWTINWQRGSTGGISAASKLGAPGSAPTLPAEMQQMVAGANTLIVSEVFFDFEPMFVGQVMDPHRLYNRAFFRPRIGSLTSLN
jgi:Flp pilus assembly protein TadG